MLLVDRATRYNWVYGLKDLSADSILSALCNFKADTGSYACCFRSDCDAKLFGKRIRDHLIDYNSKVIAAPAGRQSSNGLVELHWKTMAHMSRAYLTKKQMPHSFWFFSILHSARMMNAIPGFCTDSWLLLFSWSTELATTSARGFPCFQSVTFIMITTGRWHARIPNHTLWMVLPLVTLLHLMRF